MNIGPKNAYSMDVAVIFFLLYLIGKYEAEYSRRMYLNLIFIFILHKCIHQPVQGAASGVKIGLYSIQNDLKFKTLSNTNSMMACAILCKCQTAARLVTMTTQIYVI